jgi:uncharacterized protein (DUF433 family)
MSLALDAQPVPIQLDRDGVARIGGTRVTLDTITTVFQQGATPEEIAQEFPVVSLTDVYAVIAFYLGHRQEVEAYLEEGRLRAEAAFRKHPPLDNNGIRERLSARRQSKQ